MAKTNGRLPRQRVGTTVRTLRDERGITLDRIAGQAGISASHLSRIERGLTVPNYNVLARIADALGTDLMALTAEETTTKAVDADLDAVFTRLRVSAESRADLLRLTPGTRAELARVLARIGAGK